MLIQNPYMNLPPPRLTCNAGNVCVTTSYKYLGWKLSSDKSSSWATDFANRKKQAWHVARSCDPVWRCNAPTHKKRMLFHALVYPMLLYAAPTYPATLSAHRVMHTTCNSLLRYALSAPINWEDPSEHTSTKDLYDYLPMMPAVVCKHTLTQWGHWVRLHTGRNEGRPIHPCVATLLSTPAGRTIRGSNWPPSRILRTYAGPDYVKATSEVGLDLLELKPQNRRAWRDFVARRTLQWTMDFVERHILPRSLGGYVSSADFKRNITTFAVK
jgi:hypothetical protein